MVQIYLSELSIRVYTIIYATYQYVLFTILENIIALSTKRKIKYKLITMQRKVLLVLLYIHYIASG